MKRLILGVALVFGFLGMNAQPASAGINCSSYTYYIFSPRVVCRVTCVYCEDMFGNTVSEYCSDDCWDRAF